MTVAEINVRVTTPADVRVFLARHNMTQGELAVRFGRSRGVVNRWCKEPGEKEAITPPPELWRALEHLSAELDASRS